MLINPIGFSHPLFLVIYVEYIDWSNVWESGILLVFHSYSKVGIRRSALAKSINLTISTLA